jgi:hypothetical protein
MGIFECRNCNEINRIARRYTFRFGPHSRCPLCGTFRLRLLAEIDRIDRMLRTPMNTWQKIRGGHLYHCRYCRVQFYDKRPLANDAWSTTRWAEKSTGKG